MSPKGTGELQELPASTDAFVWLGLLYQLEMAELIPKGRRQPLWWVSRRPVRPLTYHEVHRMFERAGDQAGASADVAFAAAHRSLPDGRRPCPATHRRSARTWTCATHDNPDLSDSRLGNCI